MTALLVNQHRKPLVKSELNVKYNGLCPGDLELTVQNAVYSEASNGSKVYKRTHITFHFLQSARGFQTVLFQIARVVLSRTNNDMHLCAHDSYVLTHSSLRNSTWRRESVSDDGDGGLWVSVCLRCVVCEWYHLSAVDSFILSPFFFFPSRSLNGQLLSCIFRFRSHPRLFIQFIHELHSSCFLFVSPFLPDLFTLSFSLPFGKVTPAPRHLNIHAAPRHQDCSDQEREITACQWLHSLPSRRVSFHRGGA